MFFELKPDEKIILSLRRHWLVLTLILFRAIPFFALPFVARPLLLLYFNTNDSLVQRLFWLFSSLWWLFLWAGMAVLWINYYLDYWIVTNQRVISTYQKGLFRREISELSFSRIQDLTVDVKGLLKTFIDYGNVEIRTAGTFDKGQEAQDVNIFIFQDVPKPYEVQNILSKIHHDFWGKPIANPKQ